MAPSDARHIYTFEVQGRTRPTNTRSEWNNRTTTKRFVLNMAEHARRKSITSPFFHNQVTFRIPVITIMRISGKSGITFDIKKSLPLHNNSDDFAKMQFLSQLGLVDMETARLKIQKSNHIKTLHKERTDALVKKMLRMKPKYYLDNGKVRRIQCTPTAKKTKVVQQRLPKNVSRKRLASESRGVYFSIPKKLNSPKAESRSHLARKATTTGLGLSERSKKLLDLCPDLSIKVHRMSDSEIAQKIKKTETVGKTLQSTKCVNTIINAENKHGLSERSQKLLASCRDFSIRVHRMSESDIARKIRETQNLRKQILHVKTTKDKNSRTSFADQNKKTKTSFTSINNRPHEQDFSVDVYRMANEDIQNYIKKGK